MPSFDKKVLYALVGGAVTLVGAAVAYHFASTKSEVDEDLEAHLEELGPLEVDDSGIIKFNYYLKILQISMYYGKKEFAPKKKDYIKSRREALDGNDEKKYENIVIQMQQEEDQLFQSRLNTICERIGLSQEEFMRTSMIHQQDQFKAMQVMTIQQQIHVEEFEMMSRQQVFELFKEQ